MYISGFVLQLDSCFHFSLSTTKRNGKKSSLFRILGSVIFLTIYRQMYLAQFRVVDMRNSNTKVDFQKRISERIQYSICDIVDGRQFQVSAIIRI